MMKPREFAKRLSQKSRVPEDFVWRVLRAFRPILLDCALNDELASIRLVGKFELRPRRRYKKGISKVTGKPFGQRARFGLFFQSSDSFDDAFVDMLKAERKYPYPKTPNGAPLSLEEWMDAQYYGWNKDD